VLFDADGAKLQNIVVSPRDTDYFIIYYGYPENQKTELKVPNATYEY
jgi:hypothetical protein